MVRFISQGQQPPSNIGRYNYSKKVNPSNRTAQFGQLNFQQRRAAIKDPPTCVQAQELSPWYKPIDVMVIYLHLDEGLTLSPAGTSETAPDHVSSILGSMGFAPPYVHILYMKYTRLAAEASLARSALKLHIPLQPLAPSAMTKRTISVPGLSTGSTRSSTNRYLQR
jgi:hypothetical protein